MKNTKLLIFFVTIFFSANSYAKDIHTNINDLIAENQKGWKDFKNKDLGKFFKKDGFKDFLDVYPVTSLTGGFEWKPGMGREFIGPLSGLPIKAPFSDYIPIPDGPVLDTSKTYRIGFVYHWGSHPWLISLADTAVYEASLHSNVEIEVMDAEGDDNKMGQMIDDFIAKKMDAIVMWPAREAPMGPPVERAEAANIPVVSLDRRAAAPNISTEVLGNFYANGLQQGLFLNHVAGGEGNIVMNRKPLGSTADAMRSGAFMEAIGDYNYVISESMHTNSSRQAAFEATQAALQAHDDVSVIFNTGGEEALGALDAVMEANRLNTAPGGKKIIILVNDDSKETVNEVRKGNMDVVVPYTPLLGGIGVRAALLHIGAKEGFNQKPPKQIITPNLPMITKEKMTISGITTITPDEWPYAYGPEAE
ncbi:MAG: sugar ABC transporter substrate-binding protein [Candidatus Puniceispirillales bacterium]|jgi:ABC-type sugar transport system substrate-binding protein|tara:strand:+ start:1759 stop:3018 length:1260 start_codon:yes stop_codon:yes gene_type:complete